MNIEEDIMSLVVAIAIYGGKHCDLASWSRRFRARSSFVIATAP
jgi:hypothetical protein